MLTRRSAGWLVALLGLLPGCEALVPYHWHSAELDGELYKMVIEPVDPGTPPLQAVLPRDGIHPTLRVSPLVFQSRFEELLAHNVITSARAPSMWGARTAAEFYAEPPRVIEEAVRGARGALFELRPAVKGLRLERWLEGRLATVLDFSLEPRGGSFLVTLERIEITDCRAKVADKSWINWWARIPCIYGFWFDACAAVGMGYGDDSVDMRIDLVFIASWSDVNGEARTVPLSVVGWTVPDVPIGKPYEVHQSGGWLAFVPPSASLGAAGATEYGRGLFTVEGFVTEQDDLSPAYVADMESLGEYFDAFLGLVPNPVNPIP